MDRRTADDYVAAALVVLGEDGIEAMTIAVLCERLRVTKGSFYHHFGGLPGFVQALVERLESDHAERLAAVAQDQPDVARRLPFLFDEMAALPHGVEAAFRVWARANPDVAAAVSRVDRRWERQLTDAIAALRVDRDQARLLARMAIDMLVGVQQREYSVDVRRLRVMLGELQRVVVADADPRRAARLAATGG